MGTFNDWIGGNKQRAIKFSEIIPVGTPTRSVFDAPMYGQDGEGYTPFEGEFSGIELDYPLPIRSIEPTTGQQFYSEGDDMLVFWQGRWQTVYEIVGEEED